MAFETSSQVTRGRIIASKASRRSMGLNSVQAMITTPVPSRKENKGTSRRDTMHSRRYMGMPSYMTLPKSAAMYGPAMIPDTAQRGK